MPDKLELNIASVTIIIDLIELTIVFLTCMLFIISRKYLYNKFEIRCAITNGDKRRFNLINHIITAIVIAMAVIIPIEIIIDGRACWPWI